MKTEPANFAGLRVAAFESRRADELANLITKHAGIASVSPSMREVADAKNPAAVDFANRVITGQIDVVVFTTGGGVRNLIAQVERHVDRTRFIETLSDVVTIARGPKPTLALKELSITPTHRTAEPHTWREILALIDGGVPILNSNVGLQEYGEPNTSLIAGLEARGARVHNLHVYRWELPEDTAALAANVRAIADGRRDVVLFTSSHQIVNLLFVAEQLNMLEELKRGLTSAVVVSVGPDTSNTLGAHGIAVDLQSPRPQMGQLVAAAAALSNDLLSSKRRIHSILQAVPMLAATPRVATEYDNSLFMRAVRREPTERTPIWLMRQAGRYLPEYRAIREKTTFLELCKNPALCAEVMITTVNRLEVDAAIIFADLLPILEPMGLELEFTAGEGPVIHNPVRSVGDVDRVLELEDVNRLDFVYETVKLTRAGLPAGIPVLGFAGAPFTLASYAIEGGSSRNYAHTKSLMYRDPIAWDALLGRLSRAVTKYLNAQIAAGAQCVQLFDSWVGCLSPADYRRYVLPHMQAILRGITPGVPVINFATGNPALLPLLSEAGGAVIGIDWRVELADAWKTVGYDKAVQGNLDPLILLADRREIRKAALRLLEQAGGRPGHIFNLGHGVLPQTPVENVIELIETVKAATR